MALVICVSKGLNHVNKKNRIEDSLNMLIQMILAFETEALLNRRTLTTNRKSGIMACKICDFAGLVGKLSGQYALNILNMIDHAVNTILLGDPEETISTRIALARKAGQKWAEYVCKILTFLQKIVTFGKMTRDHCTYALDYKVLPNTREIWNWNTGEIEENPVNIIDPVIISEEIQT